MLEEKLEWLANSDIYPFHMPGHKRTEIEFANPYSVDITEIDGFDNLHCATGVLKQAQNKAAELYDSEKAYYLVNGSTCGILAAISAAVPRDSQILIARNSHKSVYNAVFLRELKPKYIYPERTSYGIQGRIAPDKIKKKLEMYPDIKAVVITSPTYDGIVSDIRKIAEEVHKKEAVLIVDEAHGAHLGFHQDFPENATRQGADLVIMSVHKTLPAFTQTALLHVCSERVDIAEIEKFLGIYETSSPSYVLMAGIEKALDIVEQDGKKYFSDYIKMLNAFRVKVSDLNNIKVLGSKDFSQEEAWGFDPGKILLETCGAMSGQELSDRLLRDYGLQMEMASGNYAVAMTSLFDRKEGFDRLSKALHEIDKNVTEKGEQVTPEDIYFEPEQSLLPYVAEEREHMGISLEKAQGMIAAEYIYLYPPGIPILVPGEKIDRRLLGTLKKCRWAGLDIQGISDSDCIKVVKM